MNRIALCLAIVAALSLFGCLSSVPLLNGGSTNVLVVGRASPAMSALLSSKDFKDAGIQYMGSSDQRSVDANSLSNIDIVILQGDPVCDRTARKAVTDRVKAGAKLVLIGDACTRVSEDSAAYGWDIGVGALGDVVPVVGGGATNDLDVIETGAVDGKFKVVDKNHPMFNGVKNFGFHSTITAITSPAANANVLAYIDASSIGKTTAPSLYAIVEGRGLQLGKSMYFAFDPATVAAQGTGRNMFLNALLYLRNAKG